MATDLERLIVTVEANTRQFERAIRSLEKTTDQAMSGVERSVKASGARQERLFSTYGDSIGKKFTESFRKAILGLFGFNFAKDSIEASAKAGDLSSKEFLGYWAIVLEKLQVMLGTALTSGWHDAATAIEKDINNVIAHLNIWIARLNEVSAATGGLFPKIRQGPLPYLDMPFNQMEALKKYQELYDKTATAAAPKLGPLQAPGAEQLADFDKVMKNLIFEEQQLGRTAEMQRVYNELKKAGVNIESEYGQAIQITAQRLHEEELQLQALKEVNDGLEASTKTFIQGLLDGQSAAESFNAALRKMADVLLDLALHSLFNPGGTSLLQNLLGSVLGLGQWTGGQLPGSSAASPGSVSNAPLGGNSGRIGSAAPQFNTNINVAGSVDQRTLGTMKGMIERNNVKQNQELQRTWGNRQARYSALRGP